MFHVPQKVNRRTAFVQIWATPRVDGAPVSARRKARATERKDCRIRSWKDGIIHRKRAEPLSTTTPFSVKLQRSHIFVEREIPNGGSSEYVYLRV